jgi:hypothetical protein
MAVECRKEGIKVMCDALGVRLRDCSEGVSGVDAYVGVLSCKTVSYRIQMLSNPVGVSAGDGTTGRGQLGAHNGVIRSHTGGCNKLK